MKFFLNYNLIIFDLDNTLIDEEDYLFQGYNKIAEYISTRYNIESNFIFEFLIDNYKKNGRVKLFDSMIEKFDLEKNILIEVLKILREFKPTHKIKIFPKMEEILITLKLNKIKYIVLTNGNTTQQKNKVKNTEWKGLMPEIVYANETEPKPSVISLEKFLIFKKLKIKKEKILFVGDDITDSTFSESYGCTFLNVDNIV